MGRKRQKSLARVDSTPSRPHRAPASSSGSRPSGLAGGQGTHLHSRGQPALQIVGLLAWACTRASSLETRMITACNSQTHCSPSAALRFRARMGAPSWSTRQAYNTNLH